MAITTIAANKTTFMNTVKAASDGDTIKVQAGNVVDLFWPESSAKHLTIAPASLSNPPTFQGIGFGSHPTDSTHLHGRFQAIRAEDSFDNQSNITFDGVFFNGPKLTDVKQTPSQTPSNYYQLQDIPNDGLGGYNWRVDFRTANNDSLGEEAGCVALVIGDTTNNIKVQNCVFDGFDMAIKVSNPQNLTVQWNTLQHSCRDAFVFRGIRTGLFQYNSYTNFRGVSQRDAQNGWGWGDGNPPHADYFQMASQGDNHNLRILSNYLHDTTGRVHGILWNNGPHFDCNINFNHFRMAHATGYWMNDTTTNIQIRGNKLERVAGSEDTSMKYSQGENGFSGSVFGGTVDISNNVMRKIQPSDNDSRIPNAWTVEDNLQQNDNTTFPDNFKHIAKFNPDGSLNSRYVAGDPFAGAYGQGGTPPVDAGDPMEDADFNMLGAMPDPAFPSPDTKMTGCIEIPPTSIAFAMPTIWWGDSDDAPLPTVLLGTTTGGSKLYRLQTAAPKAADYHMKAPGAAFTGIHVYYKDAAGVMSEKSSVTCRFTTPATADRVVVYVKPRT